MVITEREVSLEIKKFLASEDYSFDMERRIPEKLMRVDFFLFTEIPTIIEVFRVNSRILYDHLQLISKLLSLKLINGGHVRSISLFFSSDLKTLQKFQDKIKSNPLFKSITDDIIFFEIGKEAGEILKIQDFKSDLREAIKKPIRISSIIQDISESEDFKISPDRIDFFLMNLNKHYDFSISNRYL